MTKPILLWLTPSGPNPWKILHLLEELQIPYEVKAIRFEDTKLKPFTNVNPNGRVPAIEDPNTGLVLWESGAIILYLIEQYDTSHALSYTEMKDRHLCNQWLMFQVSGQGPYFGQAGWFNILHHEKLPSAIERYFNEIKRVLGVLDGALEGRESLVGDKITYADLSFVMYNFVLDLVMATPGQNPLEDFPNVKAWHHRMISRPAFQRLLVLREKYMQEQNIDANVGLPKGQSYQDAVAAAEEEKKSAA